MKTIRPRDMKSAIKKLSPHLNFNIDSGISPYIWLAVIIVITVTTFRPISDNGGIFVRVIFSLLIGAAVILFFLNYKKMTFSQAAKLVIITGLLIRVCYILLTSADVRQHDLGGINGTGHLGYIMNFANNFALPQSNYDQFYHPPLSHFLFGTQVRIYRLFSNDINKAIESIQILTCFCSSAVMVMVHRLLKQSELSEKAMLLALALCCFHPMFYILAGSVNNDMLMVFFALANILYIIKWYKQPTVKNTVFLAITCGCAIMSKLTGALTAPVIAVVFLIKLLEKQKETPRSKLFGGCVLFGVISLPLGLWFPIRNFIRFGQPLTYVRKLPESADVYCGNYTLAERFFSFPASEFVKSLYCIPQEDFNIWIYTLKCSVFGEFEYKGAEAAGVVLLFFNIALIMLSLAAMAYVLLRDKRKETFIAKATLALTWLVTMTAFIKTNLDLPYGCTMDFRYIVPTLVCGSVFIALMYDVLAKRKGAMSKSINIAITTLTVAFSVSSLVFYLSVG